jgi:23S rRNA (cytidine1920-2'-O)/16S rRNA (cytidine1409-2'-O)-methyltransferase
MAQQRADIALVERGFFESRAKAQEAIAAGLVTADGRPIRRSSERLGEGAAILADRPHPWVSRGGVKLAAALDVFGIDPRGKTCLDVGASTGGFTHVLLEGGAAKVYAVDVGHDQLDARLRGDHRVVAREGTDVRSLAPGDIAAVDIAVVDVSFISLKLVLPAVVRFCKPGASLVALIKPQFEAGRAHLKKGIVKDAAVHTTVCDEIAACLIGLEFDVMGVLPSPILGRDSIRSNPAAHLLLVARICVAEFCGHRSFLEADVPAVGDDREGHGDKDRRQRP